jgi:hypothetical protein
MFTLKSLERDAVPRALEKAERYRLLNEPEEAESICLDILAVEPDNHAALVTLLLSLTDQFRSDAGECYLRAKELLPQLAGEYERCYYSGLICERRGSAHLDRGDLGSGGSAYGWLREAMVWYEKAEALRPPQNDDALLRWNTCARLIVRHDLHPMPEPAEPLLQE